MFVVRSEVAAAVRRDPDQVVGIPVTVGVDEKLGEFPCLPRLAGLALGLHRLLARTV